MTIHKTLGYALLAVGLSTLTACGGDSDTSTASPQAVSIPFMAKSNDTEITCDTDLLELGVTADSAKISSFAFYVYDVKLKTATETVDLTLDAGTFQDADNGVTLLDFQDKNTFCAGDAKPTNKQITGTISGDVDTSEITGIDFKVGIPSDINHRDVATNVSPYNIQSLFWKWNSGHKFMRLDIKPTAEIDVTYGENATAKTLNFHLGSTGCTGDAQTGEIVSCTNPNQVPVSLSGYSVSADMGANVVLDYAELVKGVNINQDNGVKVGCMSFPNDPECPTMFSNLGMNYGTHQAAGEQTVFSVEQN